MLRNKINTNILTKKMSDEQTRMQETKITYDIFKEFHKENPDMDNKEYYEQFPTVNQGTIRNWKSKANKDKPKIGFVQRASDEEYEAQITTLQQVTPSYKEEIYEGVPAAMRYDIIKRMNENQPKPKPPKAPNTPILPIPIGGKQKMGIDKYLKIDASRNEIELNIPASELMDPEKNKKLGEYS